MQDIINDYSFSILLENSIIEKVNTDIVIYVKYYFYNIIYYDNNILSLRLYLKNKYGPFDSLYIFSYESYINNTELQILSISS